MRPQELKNTLKAGFFVCMLTLVGMVFTFLTGKQNAFFSRKDNISTLVSNAENLKKGSQVQLRGIRIGSVEDISIKDINQVIKDHKIEEAIIAKTKDVMKKVNDRHDSNHVATG